MNPLASIFQSSDGCLSYVEWIDARRAKYAKLTAREKWTRRCLLKLALRLDRAAREAT